MFEIFNKNNKVQKSKKEIGVTFRKEIPPGFVELYEIRERTNNLERGLEENKATEEARKKNVAERIVEGLKNQRRNLV